MPNQVDSSDSRKVDSKEVPSEPRADARPGDRRREARYPAQEPAEIELLFGPREPIYGTVLDVSRSGLRIELPAGSTAAKR